MRFFWKTGAGKALMAVGIVLGIGIAGLIVTAARSLKHATPISDGQTVASQSPTFLPASPGQTHPTFRDGTFTGKTISTRYGDVQVALTVASQRIIDVKFLATPNDRDRSVEINTQAKPVLRSETIQSQTANVDVVSGATTTTEGYVSSAESALGQAQQS